MKRKTSFLIDLIIVALFCALIFTSMEVIPAIWGLVAYLAPNLIDYLPDILLGAVFLLLILYVSFIKKEANMLNYIYFVILVAVTFMISTKIKDSYNKMHLFEYFMLSILSFRLFHHYIYDIRLYILALFLSLLVGIADEFTQILVCSRRFDLFDLRNDMIAALIGQFFVAFVISPKLDLWRFKLKRRTKDLYRARLK